MLTLSPHLHVAGIKRSQITTPSLHLHSPPLPNTSPAVDFTAADLRVTPFLHHVRASQGSQLFAFVKRAVPVTGLYAHDVTQVSEQVFCFLVDRDTLHTVSWRLGGTGGVGEKSCSCGGRHLVRDGVVNRAAGSDMPFLGALSICGLRYSHSCS